MIFPQNETVETVEAQRETLGASFVFDYTENRFQLVDGSPKVVTSVQAVKQWLELFVRTGLGKYKVYDGTAFGVDVSPLIGKKQVPRGAILSEIKREIGEGVRLCPAVTSVYGFALEGETISFTVRLRSGEEAGVSVGL